MNIQIVLFEGFGEMVALAPYEVLNRAKENGAPFHVQLVGSGRSLQLKASYGVQVFVEEHLRISNRPDLLIVPGGGWNHQSIHGVRNEVEKGYLPKMFSEMSSLGTIIAGVCTGGMLLGASGILKGKKATMHHLATEELKTYGAELLNYRIVDDGDVITARGVTSGIDLALWITERFAGSQIAASVENRMEYERRGVVWQRK
ncbi:DJ-1/PfpI family protein [Chengkuizengella sediminis]|uniref:DJ-1/PfpI family protein n=1 Tax=Chengkuizengella sediminis TaxID=1885917 RepID=UPI001389DBF6|nr:DJ-1/PfpI family protein [Chengkuizengella sediminis]NDI33908.1 DJ-1/PfpI family protein [Chengkuizengella sediminis]